MLIKQGYVQHGRAGWKGIVFCSIIYMLFTRAVTLKIQSHLRPVTRSSSKTGKISMYRLSKIYFVGSSPGGWICWGKRSFWKKNEDYVGGGVGSVGGDFPCSGMDDSQDDWLLFHSRCYIIKSNNEVIFIHCLPSVVVLLCFFQKDLLVRKCATKNASLIQWLLSVQHWISACSTLAHRSLLVRANSGC